jgi:hypothetical protein
MTTSTKEMTLPHAEPTHIPCSIARSNPLPRIVIAFAVAFGVIDAVATRNSMGPDGISYLDIADALHQGHWRALFNALWSPLYPFLLSLGFRIFHPAPYWEFATVHLVNLLIYLGALAAFSVFIKAFLADTARAEKEMGIPVPISPAAWAALGYALFVWSSARLTSVDAVSPDMCLSAFIYLAAALLLRIRTRGASLLNYSLLGVVLGLGFWAKAPMFPLASLFLLISIFAAADWRMGLKRALVAGLVFFAIASPLVYGLSCAKGHLTFGDSARLNYSLFINRVTRYYWQPPAATALSTQTYPAKELFMHPAVYAFTIPLQGTYPYWYDPTLWYGGVHPKFDLRGTAREVVVNLLFDARMFVRLQPAIPLAVLILVCVSAQPAAILRDVGRQWLLLTVPLAGLAMFSLVHTERRYVAPFIGLVLLGVFAGICLRNSSKSPAAFSWIICGLALFLMLQMSVSRWGELKPLRDLAAGRGPALNQSWQVSSALRDAGLNPGDKIAWIRPATVNATNNYWWARLARVQIIAEIPNDGNEFWAASAATRTAALQSLSQTGVRAVVMSDVPVSVSLPNAVPVGSTGYYVHFY